MTAVKLIDILQTHNLSFLTGRATHSTAVCAPIDFADLAAERARCYVRDVYNVHVPQGPRATDLPTCHYLPTAAANSLQLGHSPRHEWPHVVHLIIRCSSQLTTTTNFFFLYTHLRNTFDFDFHDLTIFFPFNKSTVLTHFFFSTVHF
jgi:hypothetical protein